MNKNVEKITKDNLIMYLAKQSDQNLGIPQEIDFKYKIGERVILKDMATSQGRIKSKIPGFKRSLCK